MDQAWNKLIKCLNQITDDFKEFNYDLHPGVTDKKILSLESTIKKQFPDDFKAFYKIHNGENARGYGIMKGEEFLSMERILEEWNVWKELLENDSFTDADDDAFVSDSDTGIKNNWWNIHWIPFTYDGSGNHICIDLDPSVEGNYGQIIRVWHDDSARELLANSFKEWIEEYISQLENNEYIFSDDYGILVHKSDLEDWEEE